jgi:urease accessory protein
MVRHVAANTLLSLSHGRMIPDPVPSTSLLRLLQLVTPALPVGAFHFSQGLEYAAHMQWVQDEPSALSWIQGLARCAVGTLDLPVLLRIHRGWDENDIAAVKLWSAKLIAARESAEARAEDRHMGQALAKILTELDIEPAREWIANDTTTFATLFSLAARHWNIGTEEMMTGYLWAWAENQVIASVKLIPLGQTAGQRMLDKLVREIPTIVSTALSMTDDAIGISAPAQGMAIALHETQYSRLFRS